MSKFSVKKPLTVFVAVVAILVLGVVAFTRMTPDLLPNMNFPYAMILTSYPGASPERVEEEITKPMEQSMSTLDHIKEVSSSSSENISIVILEFEEAVNMDTIGVDIQQNISVLSSAWSETVGTPYVLKINPSMLPVEVAAVSMEGMDTTELTDFLNDTLMNKLEGVPGVARVSATGMVEQEIHVVLDQKKIDEQNQKIMDAINQELDDTAADLEDKKQEIKNAQSKLNSAVSQMSGMTGNMDGMKEDLQEMVSYQASVRANYAALNLLSSRLDAALGQQQAAQAQYEALAAQRDAVEEQLENTPEEDPLYDELLTRLEELEEQTAAAEETLYTAEQDLYAIDQSLDALGTDREDLPNALENAQLDVQDADDDVAALSGKVEEGLGAMMQMSAAQAEIAVGKASLSQAMTQIESGLETLEDSREDALRQADLNGIITMDMVTQILKAQNFAMPAGMIEQNGIHYMVSVGDEITSLDTLENLLLFDLGLDEVEPIRLKDVAVVALTDNSDETYAKLNGLDGMVLTFEKQSTYATAETTDNINTRFRSLEQEFPGLRFVSLMNQGDYIYMIVDSILNSLLLGAVFAVLVLLLFLRDLRPTFITLCSIPLSVVFAIVLMYFSGVTLNMISLSGLAVSVGMLVDNSVVVIENIYRLRSKGATVIQAAVHGAKQVAAAVTASTLTTVCVFLPIVFVEGITKQLFTDLALTMTYALMASLLVSLTLVPAMASGMLRKERTIKPGLLETKVLPLYGKSVAWGLRHKALVLLLSLALLVASAAAVLAKGFTFMPTIDMPTVNVSVTMPEDTSMEAACAMADQVLEKIDTLDGIDTVGAMMGSSSMSMMSGSGSNNVTIYVNLADQNASGAAVGKQIEALCADMDCTVTASSAMMDMGELSGSGVALDLFAEDMDALQNAARTAADALAGIPGLVNISDGLEDATPAYHVEIDRNKAMEHGLTVAQIYMEIASALTTDATVMTMELDGLSADIIVEKPEEDNLSLPALRNYVFEVTNQDGTVDEVSMQEFGKVNKVSSLSSIQRINQRRYLTVTAEAAEGYNVTLLTNQAEQVMKAADLGDGVSYSFSGENETIMDAMEQLMLMLLLGVLLVYLVMVAQFQSLKSPFIVMFTIPLAFTGGFLALLICNMEISVISLIGFVMLTGVIVNNGIVLVDYINQLRLEGMERRSAIVEAGITRMRPILMTTTTTVLGLLDMAVRASAGTAMMRPVAVVCIGGLLYATLMTLYVVPCIYDIFHKKELRRVSDEDLKLLESL